MARVVARGALRASLAPTCRVPSLQGHAAVKTAVSGQQLKRLHPFSMPVGFSVYRAQSSARSFRSVPALYGRGRLTQPKNKRPKDIKPFIPPPPPKDPEPIDPQTLASVQSARFTPYQEPTIVADVVNFDKKTVGRVSLEAHMFMEEPRVDIIKRNVEYQRAKRRTIAKKVKGRGDVAGSTRKIMPQKGSGKARRGALKKSPLVKGGGKAMGPSQRFFAWSLPKKVRAMGLRCALSARYAEGSLTILDSATVDSHKTKHFIERPLIAGLDGVATLIIIGDDEQHTDLTLAVRNLTYFDIIPARGANVYDIIKRKQLVLTTAALRDLKTRLHMDANSDEIEEFVEEQEEEDASGEDHEEDLESEQTETDERQTR